MGPWEVDGSCGTVGGGGGTIAVGPWEVEVGRFSCGTVGGGGGTVAVGLWEVGR